MHGSSTSSTNQQLGDPGIEVFPNPAHDYFFVTYPHSYVNSEIMVTNIYGQEVIRHKATDTPTKIKMEVDASIIPKGIYFVKSTSHNLPHKLIVN